MNRLAMLLPLALLSACNPDEAITDLTDCFLDLNPGIVVEVVDKTSGAALAEGARGAVHEGTYIDSLYHRSATSLAGAIDRPGTYAVEVVHAGYQPWTATGIRVIRTDCSVETVTLRAELVAAP